MSDRRAIIFDFDGTIADSAPIIKAIYKDLAPKQGWTPLTDEAYETLRKGTLVEARRWAGIKFWQLPVIVKNAKRLMSLEADKVVIFPGMIGLIRELNKDENVDLYVLSRNTKDTIEAVLERKNLSKDLQVLKRRRLLGSKTATIKWLVRSKGYKKRNVYMVGDEIRDIRAAKRSHVKSIAVTWGLQDELILKRYRPTETVRTVDELRKSLQS